MNSNRDNLTKEYATDEIVVEWEPLCRCVGTGDKPFCDGTHEKIGFRG